MAQRDYYSPFGFGHYDYQVATGHASLYWDTGWYGIETQLSAGRYLAGDWGGTLAVYAALRQRLGGGRLCHQDRRHAEDFGEGSFAKGLTLSIPLRWATPFETRQTINGNVTSLANNGGAFLNIQNRLYPIVRDLDRNRLEQNWGAFWQ